MDVELEVPVPPQHRAQPLQDFRNAALGPRGYKCVNKRKLNEYDVQAHEEEMAMPMQAADEPIPSMTKRRRTDNVIGVGFASGRPWKTPAERSGAVKNPLLSTSWDKKMKLKAERDAFKAVKQDSIAAHKERLAKVRKQRQDAKSRNEANQKKSNVTQAISSNATLRKMMKSRKQRKLLQKADTLQQ